MAHKRDIRPGVPGRERKVLSRQQKLEARRKIFLLEVITGPHELKSRSGAFGDVQRRKFKESSIKQRLMWIREATTMEELQRAFQRRSDAEILVGLSDASLESAPAAHAGFKLQMFFFKKLFGKAKAREVLGADVEQIPDNESDLDHVDKATLSGIRQENKPRQKGIMGMFEEMMRG